MLKYEETNYNCVHFIADFFPRDLQRDIEGSVESIRKDIEDTGGIGGGYLC